MFDMMSMLGKVKELQAKMKEAQENLIHLRQSAESGAGLVKVTVNGKKQVVELEIDDSLIKPEEKEMLRDLVVAAVNRANEQAEDAVREEMKKQTQGILPNIPGLDLGNLFGHA